MRTAGVFLIFVGVALRGAVLFSDNEELLAVLGILAAYGVLLIAETWLVRRKSLFHSQFAQATYLLLQSALAVWLLDVSTYEDFFALLFIPPSLEAVSFFGRRYGFWWIAAFSIAILSVMQFSEQGQLFGLAMGLLYSGICFLFGGYASQVLKAEAAREQNQSAFDELQIAHRQLQGYADQVANLAVEHERNRLARDLHDSVTQTVFSMNLAAQSARILLDKEPPLDMASPLGATPRTTGQLLRLEELSANALREIQSLISQLKPRSLADEGLPSALRRLADERLSRDGLQVSLEIHGEKKLSEAETLGLYAIVNESLTNVIKHSGTREASVRLKLNDDISALEIEDHGRGFNPQSLQNQRGHLGLAGISERACEIGWTLSVESEKDQGTRILVTQNQVEESK